MNVSKWLEKRDVLMKELADFQRHTTTQLQGWKKKGSDNGLVIALEAVLAEAESLSSLLNSIADGAEERGQISELRNRFRELKMTAKRLEGQWNERAIV